MCDTSLLRIVRFESDLDTVVRGRTGYRTR
jgi:hypothetical protein